MKNLKEKTISGFVFKFLERVGAKGVGFIVSIILARALAPSEFGTISLVTVFISICDVFVTYGFGNSLIANKDSDTIDFSTCFFFGIALSIIVYCVVYFSASLLASFYDNPILEPVIRIMGIRLPIAAINSVQHAYISKHMMFKKFFFSTLIGTIVSGIFAIIMVKNGFGVWALVEQSLGIVVIDTVVLWFVVDWKPQFVFSFKRLKKIYNYGWRILVVGLIDTGYNQLRKMIIGKKFSSDDLAFYDKGMQFPSFGVDLIEPTINSVIFPSLSLLNNNIELMKNATRRMIKTFSYVLFPVMIGLAVTGKSLIVFLLTEKWLPSWPYLMIGCLAFLFRPMLVINNSIIKASGRSDLLLFLDLLKKSIGIVILLVSIPYGPLGIAVSLAVSYFVSTFISIFPNQNILGYGYFEQIKDISINAILSVAMGVIIYPISFFKLGNSAMLCLQVVIGIFSYIFLSFLTKNESFAYLVNFFLNKKLKLRKC